MVNISGNISYCTNPGPIESVTVAVTGSSGATTTTDASGNYSFTLLAGGTYTLTPSKDRRPLGSSGINTIDALAIQRHYLQLGTPLSGCALAAADITGDGQANTTDALGVQRFFLAAPIGTGSAGNYVFTPVARNYSAVVTDQTGQDYSAIILGDVVAGFVQRPEGGPLQSTEEDQASADEVSPVVAKVALPNVIVDTNTTKFVAGVICSPITARDNLVGFQADVNFDSTAITFANESVQKAGLTNGDWNVNGRVLDGPGPIRTLRISAFSNDFEPLAGEGTLFELLIVRTGKTDQITQLFWAQRPDHLIFIDADLKTHKPGYTAAGSITPSWEQQRTKPGPDESDSSTSSNDTPDQSAEEIADRANSSNE